MHPTRCDAPQWVGVQSQRLSVLFVRLITDQPGNRHPISALIFVPGSIIFNVRRVVQDVSHHLAQSPGALAMDDAHEGQARQVG